MGLRDDMLQIPYDARYSYDEESNVLFLNFSQHKVKSLESVERGKNKIRSIVEPLGHKVYAVVNYDGFEVDPDVEEAYLGAIKEMAEKYYLGVTRFTTSAFMRAKLGEKLNERGVAPHIFESEKVAKAAVREPLQRE